MSGRIINTERIAYENMILKSLLEKGQDLKTDISMVTDKKRFYRNPHDEQVLGRFRHSEARKIATADMSLIEEYRSNGLKIPSFLEAGPRKSLLHNPSKTRAAIVTTGGLCPGLHRVIHSIVTRHHSYGTNYIFGIYDSFRGLCHLADNIVELSTTMTEEWLDSGGSRLGSVRYYHNGKKDKANTQQMVTNISENLKNHRIDILYVIGGDGSLKVAHEIAKMNPNRSIVGIPKTMDNDILWVWQSFGFRTAVEEATHFVNTLHSEAASTRRVCLIELFGAESGFVAANATLASGHVDLVLIPEVFSGMGAADIQTYMDECIEYIDASVKGTVQGRERPVEKRHNIHAVIVMAEGVGTILAEMGMSIRGKKIKDKANFIKVFRDLIQTEVKDTQGEPMDVFENQPRHNIRAVSANPQDQIFCERLGASAVDNALAGYTDFMISQWLTEFVLVPLELVGTGQKGIPLNGTFWKQVINSTGQPLSVVEKALPGQIGQPVE